MRCVTVDSLGIMNLHDGMILSTLSISSRGFTSGFSERPRANGDVFLTYKPMHEVKLHHSHLAERLYPAATVISLIKITWVKLIRKF